MSNAKQNLKNNAIVRNEFATNANQDNRFDQVAAIQQKRPVVSLKKKIQLDNVMSDNAMISIYPLGSKYYCFYESPFIRCIDPISLSTLDSVDLNKKMGLFQCSSHPQVCIALGYFYSSIFCLLLSLCRRASRPYRLSHINALCINQSY